MNAISSSIIVLAGAILMTGAAHHTDEAWLLTFGAGLLVGIIGLVRWFTFTKGGMNE